MTPVKAEAQRSVGEITTAPAQTTVQRSGKRSDVIVALAQVAPKLGDLDSNIALHLDVIRQARQGDASLVVFPELSLTGYFLKDLVPDVSLRLDSPELQAIAAACTDIDAVIGCVVESDDWRFYNASVYVSGGRIRHVHRKVYLPTYGLFDESRYFAAGDQFEAFEATFGHAHPPRAWRAGTLICEDMWHTSAAALLARQGVDLFICPSASPGRGVGRGAALGTARSYDVMTRTYAQLHTAYVVYVNRAGYEDGVAFWGGSRVVGPDGSPLHDPASRTENLLFERLDFAALRRARIINPVLRDERHDVNDAESDRIRRSGN